MGREIIFEEEIKKARNEAEGRKKDAIEWSGQDIMTRFDPYKARIALESLSQIRVWPRGSYGYFKRFRSFTKGIVKGAFFENFMTLCVTINTVTLAIDHYGITESTESLLG